LEVEAHLTNVIVESNVQCCRVRQFLR
jgi:hypothetical protein